MVRGGSWNLAHHFARASSRIWYLPYLRSPQDIRQSYVTASIVAHNRAIFNIRGNRYRVVVAVNYAMAIVFIRFVGSHTDYDKIDAATV